MRIYVKEPGKVPVQQVVPNELHVLQELVGGYIEVLTLFEDLALICDEEGRLKNKPYNCEVCGIQFCGPIVFVGVDGDNFCDVPWTGTEEEFGYEVIDL